MTFKFKKKALPYLTIYMKEKIYPYRNCPMHASITMKAIKNYSRVKTSLASKCIDKSRGSLQTIPPLYKWREQTLI